MHRRRLARCRPPRAIEYITECPLCGAKSGKFAFGGNGSPHPQNVVVLLTQTGRPGEYSTPDRLLELLCGVSGHRGVNDPKALLTDGLTAVLLPSTHPVCYPFIEAETSPQ